MAPRSWKPEVTLGDEITDDQLELQMKQGARDLMWMLGKPALKNYTLTSQIKVAQLLLFLAFWGPFLANFLHKK